MRIDSRHDVPLQLVAITDHDIRLDLIVDIGVEFVRSAASIRSGRCTVSGPR